MSTLEQIRKEVVEYLLERHSQEKEAGREFYFTVDTVQNRFLPPFPTDRAKLLGEESIKILCYGDWAPSPIAYLIIDISKQLYLIIEFRNAYDPTEFIVLNKLKNKFESYYKTDLVDGVSGREYFFRVLKIYKYNSSVIDKLNYFFNDVKPDIDFCVNDLKDNPKHSYYFFNRQQFEDYLKTEPFYTPPVSVAKRNLALKSLRVQNYKGIKQLVIDDLPASARWIILTGENGLGKTSVLQAIAAGLYGNNEESGTELVTDRSFVGVEYYANGEPFETNSRTPRLDAAPLKLANELATYGSSRLQVSASVTREMIEQQEPTTYHLFNSNGLLLNIEQYLKDTYSFNRPVFEKVVSLFKELLPTLSKIEIVLANKIPEVRYYEQDEEGKLVTDGLSFSQLASGFKNIIAMVGDLVYRLSSKQNVDDFSDLEGIVIIDELELHLHPRYQKLLPEILSKHFPKIQFIASTHSAIPLLGVPKDTVLLHVTRSEEKGIEVERLDVDFSVLTPNAILSSPIFGFKDLIPDSKAENRMIQPEDSYEEMTENRQLRSQIKEFLSPEKQQELLKLLKEK
ncbi:AAA family ATPase [Larkinella sp. VNQ87]|uniref:AAA family ATPase n=1 Tax=Larkinella sp. VNQ87 TaxID=3400921 RepID=UPI003C047CF0